VAVVIEMVAALREAGIAAEIVSGRRGYAYPHMTVPGLRYSHDPRLADTAPRPRRFAAAAVRYRRLVVEAARRSARLAASEIVVFPEYAYADLAPRFPECRRVLLVQDVHGFARAFLKDRTGVLGAFDAVLCTSDASEAALRAVGCRDVRRVVLRVGRSGMGYREKKRRRIAYMPRKRPHEAAFAAKLLRDAPEAAGFEITELARMDDSALAEALGETLLFLSFSDREGFGLPPAEALLCGCLVVGYDGIGGREYFDLDAARAVPDSDVVALVRTARAVLAAYAEDPGPLDADRRKAAREIAARYSAEAFAASVLRAFRDLTG
jgi:hypothetical protein